MKKYIIERDISGVGAFNREELKGAAADFPPTRSPRSPA